MVSWVIWANRPIEIKSRIATSFGCTIQSHPRAESRGRMMLLTGLTRWWGLGRQPRGYPASPKPPSVGPVWRFPPHLAHKERILEGLRPSKPLAWRAIAYVLVLK